jgi:hypothetical protein
MATEKQIAANKANAQHCKGPVTPEGKRTSSQNAVKHGLDSKSEIMLCESRDDYETLIAELYANHNPQDATERCFVDSMIQAEWLKRRYMSAEALVWQRELRLIETRDVGLAFKREPNTIYRANRLRSFAQRDFTKALKDLTDYRAKKPASIQIEEPSPVPLPEPEAPKTEETDEANTVLSPKLDSFRTNAETLPMTSVEAPAVTSEIAPAAPPEEENPPIAA